MVSSKQHRCNEEIINFDTWFVNSRTGQGDEIIRDAPASEPTGELTSSSEL
ncbi:hypothetical protein [Streptomyces pseudovenezuelae]|uniref:Uncharacterized protein n=1 Tax=Streptomyces pseudovenezuelae TaxID=67350 RepID=A0ABT6LDF1_9ACTN|nr:hypothetical protein [Streptomyces pseudovenezuelae]MDH6214337.1 hypothetical protein [Streptomyces pseudovenezuelae]